MKKWMIVCEMCLMMLASHADAEFRALLVGINYAAAPNAQQRLRGAINDVTAMREAMTQQFGIPDAAIKTLTEEEATRDNLIAAFETWLIEGTKPGIRSFSCIPGMAGKQNCLKQSARK